MAPPSRGSLTGKPLTGVNPTLVEALQALAQAGHQVNVTSGYRSYAAQVPLYQRYVNSGYNPQYIAAKPGQSNHQRGLAADVFVDGMPVGRDNVALQLLGRYGVRADVPGDWEHLDLVGGHSSLPHQLAGVGASTPAASLSTSGIHFKAPVPAAPAAPAAPVRRFDPRILAAVLSTHQALGLPPPGPSLTALLSR